VFHVRGRTCKRFCCEQRFFLATEERQSVAQVPIVNEGPDLGFRILLGCTSEEERERSSMKSIKGLRVQATYLLGV